MKLLLLLTFLAVTAAYQFDDEDEEIITNQDAALIARNPLLKYYDLSDEDRELINKLSDEELNEILMQEDNGNDDEESSELMGNDPFLWRRRRRRRRRGWFRRIVRGIGNFFRKHGKAIGKVVKSLHGKLKTCCKTGTCAGKWYCFIAGKKDFQHEMTYLNEPIILQDLSDDDNDDDEKK